jgi:hypothetical protein
MARYHHNSFAFAVLEGAVKLTWRWNTGAELDGKPRTDATWTARGEQALTTSGKASQWSYLPRLTRFVIRHGVVVATLATLYGMAAAPTLTRLAWGLTLAGVAVYLGYRVRAALALREHRDTYVLPLGMTLGPMLGHTDSLRADKIEKWLTFPLDFLTSEERPEMRVALLRSVAYDDKLKTAALKLVADKIGRGLDDLDYKWHGMGAAPYISIRLAPKPPTHVGFDQLKPLMEKAPDSAPVMGVAARGKVIASDFDAEAPHAAASAGSGSGKSVWGRLLIAQDLNRGTQVVVLDKKRVSQNWCANLPGVTYCKDAEKMHNTLIALASELIQRYDIIDAAPDPDNADVGSRIKVYFEEQNIGMKALKKYWEEIRGPKDPKRSPAIDALDELLCAGRQAKMHVVSIAQLFTVQATGGDPVARENYATRLMARATQNAWKMLAPECAPFPKINRKRGRWYICADGVATEFQVGFLSEEEAIAWATSGHVTVPAQWTAGADQASGGVTGPGVTGSEEPQRYSLAEAVKLGFVGEIADEAAEKRRHNWLRQRKNRDRDNFPKGVTEGGKTTYTEAEIRGWYEASTLNAVASGETEE